MGRDKRVYRFVQDTRFGRTVIANYEKIRVWSTPLPTMSLAAWSSVSALWPTMSPLEPDRFARGRPAELDRREGSRR